MAGLVLVSCFVGPVPMAAAEAASAAECVATTKQGTLRGRADEGMCRYHGVRYAAPPVGDRRFRAPAPPPRWSGVRRVGRPSNVVCPRVAPNIGESYVGGRSVAKEDCLRLSITAPHSRSASPRPVIVYLHGGGFFSGSGAQADFDGARLARTGDAVIVRVNYRLGLLGWMELGGASKSFAGSGNNGLRDQVAALRWVRRNIGAFGGDPGNVTLMGQSAGATSISAMLATAEPQRLMRRAIVVSGNGYLMKSRARAAAVSRELLQIAGTDDPRRLQRMSVADLMAVQSAYFTKHPLQQGSIFAPIIDGNLVRGTTVQRLAHGHAKGIDLIIGTTKEETTFFALLSPPLYYLPPLANPFFPNELRAQQVPMIATYQANRPDALLVPRHGGVLHAMMSDQMFRVPATRMAEAQSRWADVYAYRFDWHLPEKPVQPPGDQLGAFHTLDVQHIFGSLRFGWVPRAPELDATQLDAARRLSRSMQLAYATFARAGTPNADGGAAPHWARYDARRRATMIWDTRTTRTNAPADDERALWDDFAFHHFAFPLPVG